MSGLQLNLKVDLSGLRKGFTELETKQLPFARAQALTMTAGRAAQAWQADMERTLDRPTPFTVNSVAVLAANKSNLKATVFIKDIAAKYIEPFVVGGPHFSRGANMLTPKDIRTNAYGNLPRQILNTLKGRKNIFIGHIETKNGQTFNGVWERVDLSAKGAAKGGKRSNRGSVYSEKHGRLRLLIRFNDPMPVKQRLDLRGVTLTAVTKWHSTNFTRAFAKAMASAR